MPIICSRIKPFVKKGAIVTDVGSTKTNIHETVTSLSDGGLFRRRPSGPVPKRPAMRMPPTTSLENAYYIITPTGKDSVFLHGTHDRVAKPSEPFRSFWTTGEHDFIVAAISHLPHLIASSP